MIRVYCRRCDRWFADAASCDCPRPLLKAHEVRVPAPRRSQRPVSHFAKVLMTAASLGPRTEAEMETALRIAARSLREVN